MASQLASRARFRIASTCARFQGHKNLRSTEIYINIEHTLFDPTSNEFAIKVAEKPEDVKTLLEVGFEYVCQKDGLMFLRKRN